MEEKKKFTFYLSYNESNLPLTSWLRISSSNTDNVFICLMLIHLFIYSISILSAYFAPGPILEVGIHGAHLIVRYCITNSDAY